MVHPGGRCGWAMRVVMSSTAWAASSRCGWAIVVSRGLNRSAQSKSSKAASAMSLGTDKPRSRMGRIAPIVIWLFATISAVGGSGICTGTTR